jgi:hypothetical protein
MGKRLFNISHVNSNITGDTYEKTKDLTTEIPSTTLSKVQLKLVRIKNNIIDDSIDFHKHSRVRPSIKHSYDSD